MLDEKNSNNPKAPKFWSLGQILAATLITTPFAGCYLISKNFKLLKLEKQSKNILIIGVLLNLILLPIIIIMINKFIPKTPQMIVPLIFAVLLQYYAKNTQETGLQHLKDSGIKRHSFLSWLGTNIILGVLGILLILIVGIPLALVFNLQ